MRPPKLTWSGNQSSGPYQIQSEQVRGEPRVYYAELVSRAAAYHSVLWSGPSRSNRRSAQIDAEYHAAGRAAERGA